MSWINRLDSINIFKSSEFRQRINEMIAGINDLYAQVGRLSRRDGNKRLLADRGIAVELTARTATNEWEWKEKVWDDAAGEWVDRTGGLAHDDLGTVTATGGPADASLHLASVGDVVYIHPRQKILASGNVLYEFTPTARESFWAKITGNAADGDNKWKYAWTEQERTASGWQDKTDGRSGTTSSGFAINSLEANNSGSGTQGNSVDIDGTIFDDNTGLEVQPVEGNPVVRMWAGVDTNGDPAYSFEYVNAVDGECA